MVAQDRRPALTRSSWARDHVLGDSRLGDLDAEFEQLAVDLRCAPQSIHPAHLSNQIADLPGDRRPTTSGPRLPAPKGLEPAPMPTDQCLGLDDHDSV